MKVVAKAADKRLVSVLAKRVSIAEEGLTEEGSTKREAVTRILGERFRQALGSELVLRSPQKDPTSTAN